MSIRRRVAASSAAALTAGLLLAAPATAGVTGTAFTAPAGSDDSVTATQSTATVAAGPASALTAGSQLVLGESLSSPNGKYTVTLQGDGNAVVSAVGRPLWASGARGARFVLQGDGNLVLYAADGAPTWSSGTHGSGAVRAAMQDDGNLVLYTQSGRAVWWTGVDPYLRDRATGATMTAGQLLPPDAELTSADRRHRFIMQDDGNLVLYTDGRPTWSTGTTGAGNHVRLQGDGNLVVYRAGNTAAWSSGTAGRGGTRLVVQGDGNTVLYGAGAVWSTGTAAPSATAPSDPNAAHAAEVLHLVNQQRLEHGCAALTVDPALAESARLHSLDLGTQNYFSHTGQNGSSPSTRAWAQGFSRSYGVGENIAAGYGSPQAAVTGWMGSPGHRAAILNCGYQYTGVGVAQVPGSQYRIYWTQVFASGR